MEPYRHALTTNSSKKFGKYPEKSSLIDFALLTNVDMHSLPVMTKNIEIIIYLGIFTKFSETSFCGISLSP